MAKGKLISPEELRHQLSGAGVRRGFHGRSRLAAWLVVPFRRKPSRRTNCRIRLRLSPVIPGADGEQRDRLPRLPWG